MIFESYKNIIGDLGTLYMLRQILTILGLFTAGLILLRLIRKKPDPGWEILLSFPLGLSVYSVLGFFLLLCGIRFNALSVIIAWIVLIAGVIIYGLKCKNTEKKEAEKAPVLKEAGVLAAAYIGAALIAVVASSGLLTQYVTNDSVYYYSMYPSILVHDGFISLSLDRFLTDVGQTTAIVQCLPFLFGFDESFGLQHFMNFNFILIFFTALYESFRDRFKNKALLYALSVAGTLLLVSFEPFIVLSKWVLSNVYFMEFFFLVFYLSIKADREEVTGAKLYFPIFFLTAFLAMSRMEGGVLVFVLAVTVSVLKLEDKDLFICFALPLALTELWYYGMLYLKVGVDPLYSFLDIKTALLMTGMIAALVVYIIFIRKRLPLKAVPFLLTGGLVIANLGLLFINRERYITNLKAFILNIRQGNGWGIFIMMFVIYGILLIYGLYKHAAKGIPVSLFLPAVFALTVILVCFARGGVLAVRTSDSGNRVLMEMVPLVIYSVYAGILTDFRKETFE